MSHFQCK